MPKGKTWREYYAPLIKEIIDRETANGKTVKQIRVILYKANPGYYGHMKKTWSDESLKQLGLKKRKPRNYYKHQHVENPNQEKLFD